MSNMFERSTGFWLWFALLVCGCAVHNEPKPAVVLPVVGPTDPHAWRVAVPASGRASNVEYPVTVRRSFESGLSLYSITRAASTQSLGVVCKAGSLYDPPGLSGTSGLVARMLTEGTERLDAEALAVASERLGTELTANSSQEAITLEMEVLPHSVAAGMELLAEVIRTPGFRPVDFERVRRERLDELMSERETPSTLAALVARRALLGAAGQSVLGASGEVSKLSTHDLRAFHRAAVVPSRCAIVSAGPLSRDELSALVRKHWATWTPLGSKLERRTPVWPNQSRVLFVERRNAVQTSVFLISATAGRTVANFEARQVINGYFGGIFTSRISTNLREKNAFTYGAYSRLSANPDYGVWSVQTDVKSQVTVQAIAALLQERQILVDGSSPNDAEVLRAKASLIQRNNARLEHTNALLDALRVEFLDGLDADYFATLGSRFERLTPAELMAELPHFAPAVSVLALVGPAGALADKRHLLDVAIERVDVNWLDAPEP